MSDKVNFSQIKDLIESMSDGVIMFDHDFKVLIVNSQFKEFVGTEKDETAMEMFLGYFELDGETKKHDPHKYIAENQPGIWTWLTMNEALTHCLDLQAQIHFTKIELNGRFFDVQVVPVNTPQRNNSGGSIVLHDITHIVEVDRMKTEFVSVASHQLRTPLTAIRLYVEMLEDSEVGPLNELQQDYLSNVHESTNRMIDLINDFLNVSRLESGSLKIEPELLDLSKIVQDTIKEVQPLADEQGCGIHFKVVNSEMSRVPLDSSMLHQAIHNLVVNAIEYSNESNPQVDITVSFIDNPIQDGYKEAYTLQDGFYLIQVSDNGIGIPDKDQKQIFSKFYRAENALKKKSEGSGLGLYIVNLIMDESGGLVWFNSKAGKGTSFYLAIPKNGMKRKKGNKTLS